MYVAATEDTTIEGGDPLTIHGIVLSSPAQETVTFLTGDGSATIFTFRTNPGSVPIPIRWVASNGIKVDPTTNVDVTIFYELSG